MNFAKKAMKGAMSVNRLIGMVVVALVLGLLIPTIADYTIGINTSASNVTGTIHTLVSFVPMVIVLMVIVTFFRSVSK